ncbi:MAG: polymorphic toxin-type HINT domain-containing protein, partial [Isosphaeraceae bacterium]
MTLATMGVGAVGTCAGRAAYGAKAFYAAKAAQAAFVAKDAYDTYQTAAGTVEAWRKGDVVGVVTGIAFTALGGIGTVGSVKALAKACFAAGTLLEAAEGLRPIERFWPGDRVWARDEHDPAAVPRLRRVVQVFQTYAPLVELRVGGRLVRTTAEHPFFVEGRGWTQAQQLCPGDRLLGLDTASVAVDGITDAGESAAVYNLEVEEDHTYFVGGQGWGFAVWAHN